MSASAKENSQFFSDSRLLESRQMQKKDDNAALLPADPSAAVQTEPLPSEYIKHTRAGIFVDCSYCGEKSKDFYSLNPDAKPDMCRECCESALGHPIDNKEV